MKKHLLFLCAAIAAFSLTSISCTPDKPEESKDKPETPVSLKAVKIEVDDSNNWVFDAQPVFKVHVENPNTVEVKDQLRVLVFTDRKEVQLSLDESDITIPADGLDIDVTPSKALEPGFYKIAIFVGRVCRTFYFGVRPTEIVSAPDYQPDFNTFWEDAKTQLKGIDLNAQLTEITTKSTTARKVYLVEMNSVPDGLTGEPVVVRGYYVEPQDHKKHPVIMHFQGYDDQAGLSKAYCPYGGSSQDYAEFWLSTRGQVVNNRKAEKREPDGHGDFVNTYGDWFAFNFGQRDAYYYRGAFMDCVQAVRFMASRAICDMDNLFAEGSSQGGALSYAVASLSDYPFTAIAPCVAFLGDYPDYFDIVSWPGNTARENQGTMTDEEMFAFLSYFDTKNLVTRIPATTAVIACSGLQDGICPPHTNIAAFNNLATTDKEYYYYPHMGHEIPSGWDSKILAFFKARIK